jgi:hypothetical protein
MADVSSYVVLGFPIEERMFFTREASGKFACASGHEAPSSTPSFCAQCGKPIRDLKFVQPTEGVTRWCQKLDVAPEKLWDMLRDDWKGLQGSNIPEEQRGLGIFNINPITSSDDNDARFALGFRVLQQRGEGVFKGTNGIPVSSLDDNPTLRRIKFLERHALWVGWEKQLPVQLLLTVYWSI